jgi:lysophospholipase L1-like esterase
MSRLRDLGITILDIAVAAMAAFVVGEIAVRLYAGHPLRPLVPPQPYIDPAFFYVKSPTRLYDLRPNQDEEVGYRRIRIKINGYGFRDDADPVVPKPPGTWRAIVLGDSFTFSGKVNVGDTFAKRLEKNLSDADRSRRYEVLNLGVPGYKSRQQLDLLRDKGLRLQPDLVIVDYTLNGPSPEVQLLPERPARWPALNRLFKRFDLVQFLYANWKQYSYIRRGDFLRRGVNYPSLAEGSERWEASKRDLAEMKRLTDANGVRLLVVMWPVFVELDDRYPYAEKHRLVVDACRQMGIPVLDLLPAFRGVDATTLWVGRDDHHPNPAAQSRVAEAVAAELRADGVVPAKPVAAS